MVAIPRVKYGLAFSVRYASRLVERELSVVGFAERMRRGFSAQITMR